MAGSPQHEALRSLPQVEELLRDARLQQIAAILPRNVVVEAARGAVDGQRSMAPRLRNRRSSVAGVAGLGGSGASVIGPGVWP